MKKSETIKLWSHLRVHHPAQCVFFFLFNCECTYFLSINISNFKVLCTKYKRRSEQHINASAIIYSHTEANPPSHYTVYGNIGWDNIKILQAEQRIFFF